MTGIWGRIFRSLTTSCQPRRKRHRRPPVEQVGGHRHTSQEMAKALQGQRTRMARSAFSAWHF